MPFNQAIDWFNQAARWGWWENGKLWTRWLCDSLNTNNGGFFHSCKAVTLFSFQATRVADLGHHTKYWVCSGSSCEDTRHGTNIARMVATHVTEGALERTSQCDSPTPGTTPRLRDCLSIFCGAHHASITSAMSSYQHVGTILPRVLQNDGRSCMKWRRKQ